MRRIESAKMNYSPHYCRKKINDDVVDKLFGYVCCTAPSLSEREKEGEALLNKDMQYKCATPLKLNRVIKLGT